MSYSDVLGRGAKGRGGALKELTGTVSSRGPGACSTSLLKQVKEGRIAIARPGESMAVFLWPLCIIAFGCDDIRWAAGPLNSPSVYTRDRRSSRLSNVSFITRLADRFQHYDQCRKSAVPLMLYICIPHKTSKRSRVPPEH